MATEFRFDTGENEPSKNLQNFRKMHFRKMHFRKMNLRKVHSRKMHFRKMHFRKMYRSGTDGEHPAVLPRRCRWGPHAAVRSGRQDRAHCLVQPYVGIDLWLITQND